MNDSFDYYRGKGTDSAVGEGGAARVEEEEPCFRVEKCFDELGFLPLPRLEAAYGFLRAHMGNGAFPWLQELCFSGRIWEKYKKNKRPDECD